MFTRSTVRPMTIELGWANSFMLMVEGNVGHVAENVGCMMLNEPISVQMMYC